MHAQRMRGVNITFLAVNNSGREGQITFYVRLKQTLKFRVNEFSMMTGVFWLLQESVMAHHTMK